MDVRGIIPPMVTPVTGRDGMVDRDALREYVRYLLNSGVDGLFPCGTTGEFTSLSTDQRRDIVECVVEASGDNPVLAGCGGTSLTDVTSHVEHASSTGADAAVVVTPYYLSSTDDELVRYYETIADRADIPIVIYLIPKFANHKLSVDAIGRVANHGNIVAVKDSSGDLLYHYRLLRRLPSDFNVLQGSSYLTPIALTLGSSGATPGIGNVIPEMYADLYTNLQNGRDEDAWDITRDVIFPMINAGTDLSSIAQLKYLLSLKDIDVGPPLPPVPMLTNSERGLLRDRYEAVTSDT